MDTDGAPLPTTTTVTRPLASALKLVGLLLPRLQSDGVLAYVHREFQVVPVQVGFYRDSEDSVFSGFILEPNVVQFTAC